jgi:CysZ protein
MIADVVAAFAQTFSSSFRSILWKSLGLTLLLLAFAWFLADRLAAALLVSSPLWMRIPAMLATGAGLIVCAAYLIAPISALVMGFYADDLAALVEWELDPNRIGRSLPAAQALWVGLRFAGLAVVVNAIALAVLFAPGVNVVAFLGANAYLFGRISFELAALRHRTLPQTLDLYQRNAGYVFVCGLWIALFLSVPIMNLLTPLFAVALMARAYDRLDAIDGRRSAV